MGSGKGKSKRSQSLMQGDPNWTPIKPRDAVSKWKEFVKDQKLESTTVSDYYPHDPKKLDEALVKVTNELLRDLETIGVVSLPRGAKIDGISPKVVPSWESDGFRSYSDTLILETRNPRARRRKAFITDDIRDLLVQKRKLGNLRFDGLIAQLANAVNALYDLQTPATPLYNY